MYARLYGETENRVTWPYKNQDCVNPLGKELSERVAEALDPIIRKYIHELKCDAHDVQSIITQEVGFICATETVRRTAERRKREKEYPSPTIGTQGEW